MSEPGRNLETVEAYKVALEIDPGFNQARHNLGAAFRILGKNQDAKNCFVDILKTESDNVDALNNFATLQMADHLYGEALEPLRHAGTMAPATARVLTNLLQCLEHMNLLAEASEFVFRLEAAGPVNARGKLITSRIERRTGREAKAASSLRRLLKTNLKPGIHALIFFKLGLILDRTDQPEEAFDIFIKAMQSREGFDPSRYCSRVARDRNWFTVENLKLWDDSIGDNTPVPVFLVGFPCSGTTLLEEILRAHPAIVSTGGTSPLAQLRNYLHQQGNYPENLGMQSLKTLKNGIAMDGIPI